MNFFKRASLVLYTYPCLLVVHAPCVGDPSLADPERGESGARRVARVREAVARHRVATVHRVRPTQVPNLQKETVKSVLKSSRINERLLTLILPSYAPLTILLLSKRMHLTSSSWPSSTRRQAPHSMSHSRMVLSELPLTTSLARR